MKKSLLFFISNAIATLSFAQIPNSGFENWTSMGSYNVPNDWGTMNNTTSMAGVYTATKGTPGSPGTAYLKLTSKTVQGYGVVNGIAVSGRLDSITRLPISGFAYNQRPSTFTGKWQHMIYGSSQGSVSATLTRWDSNTNQRVTVATANITLSGMAMSWASFTKNFTYVDGGFPDSCIIVLKASGANPTNNDYLWVDNLAFAGNVTGIQNKDSFLKGISLYPNPSEDQITMDMNFANSESVRIEMSDVNGNVVLVQNAGTLHGESRQTLDVSSYSKGTYFIRIITESGVEVKKIVIK